jgi:hypothetical protein
MNKKGAINALELVFAMFILIVVALVLIRMFSTQVTANALPKIDDFRQTYEYDKEVEKCKAKCSDYTEDCSDLSAAVDFCTSKVAIDIDGDFKTAGKGHAGIVTRIPYCEDGLYCFHLVQDCNCGTVSLDAEHCQLIMKEYYTSYKGLDDATADQIICSSINWGTCEPDPNNWNVKKNNQDELVLRDGSTYKPTTVQSGKYAGQTLGADYWWKNSGYEDICSLSCYNPSGTQDITCSWSGCSVGADVLVAITGGFICYNAKSPSGSGECTVTVPSSGVYEAVLTCDDVVKAEKSVTVS